MSIETLSDVPLYAARPSRYVAPKRKAASWIAVGIIHLLILNLMLFSQNFASLLPHGTQRETILDITGAHDETTPTQKVVIPQSVVGVPPEIRTAPPPPPPPELPPPPTIQEGSQPRGDLLGALGREIACSPGHYENLNEAERTRCGRVPWQGAQLPNGAIVLNRPQETNPFAPPPPEYHMSGADAQRLQVERANPCPMMINIPCLNRIPGRDD